MVSESKLGSMTNGERMAVLETKMDTVINKVTDMDEKLDNTIKNKAEKQEVDSLKDRFYKVVGWSVTTVILLFVSMVAFLLKEVFF